MEVCTRPSPLSCRWIHVDNPTKLELWVRGYERIRCPYACNICNFEREKHPMQLLKHHPSTCSVYNHDYHTLQVESQRSQKENITHHPSPSQSLSIHASGASEFPKQKIQKSYWPTLIQRVKHSRISQQCVRLVSSPPPTSNVTFSFTLNTSYMLPMPLAPLILRGRYSCHAHIDHHFFSFLPYDWWIVPRRKKGCEIVVRHIPNPCSSMLLVASLLTFRDRAWECPLLNLSPRPPTQNVRKK